MIDWKEALSEFRGQLERLLENFQPQPSLPDCSQYPWDEPAYDHFAQYQAHLQAQGFQLGFIDVDADAFYIFAHPQADRPQIAAWVKANGYDYLDEKL